MHLGVKQGHTDLVEPVWAITGTRLLIITREPTVAHLPRFRFGPAPGSGELL